jgi:hypothetical protein
VPGRVEGPAVAFAFRATAVERGPVFLLPVPYSLVLVFLYPGTSSLAPQPAYSHFKTSSTRRSRAQSPPTTINGCPILRLFLAKGGTQRSPRRERAASASRKTTHPFFEKQSTRRSHDQTYHRDRQSLHNPRHTPPASHYGSNLTERMGDPVSIKKISKGQMGVCRDQCLPICLKRP